MMISIHVNEETHQFRIAYSRKPSSELDKIVMQTCNVIDPNVNSGATTYGKSSEYTPVAKAIADLLNNITVPDALA